MPPPPSPSSGLTPRAIDGPQPLPCPPRRSAKSHRPAVAFALITAIAAVIWLAILPQLARTPAIERYIERNERLGIDPGAKFYSELPAMPEIWQRLKKLTHDQHAASGS